jgi:hypothetical protein
MPFAKLRTVVGLLVQRGDAPLGGSGRRVMRAPCVGVAVVSARAASGRAVVSSGVSEQSDVGRPYVSQREVNGLEDLEAVGEGGLREHFPLNIKLNVQEAGVHPVCEPQGVVIRGRKIGASLKDVLAVSVRPVVREGSQSVKR